jgi:hypothetical protein
MGGDTFIIDNPLKPLDRQRAIASMSGSSISSCRVSKGDPEDVVATLFAERCARYPKAPPASGWQEFGPVPAHQPIVTTFGNKGLIAFYEPDGAHCGLYAVVYNLSDESGTSAAQVRLSMNAGQVVNIDSPDNKSLSLQCGNSAEALKIVDSEAVAANWPQR